MGISVGVFVFVPVLRFSAIASLHATQLVHVAHYFEQIRRMVRGYPRRLALERTQREHRLC